MYGAVLRCSNEPITLAMRLEIWRKYLIAQTLSLCIYCAIIFEREILMNFLVLIMTCAVCSIAGNLPRT